MKSSLFQTILLAVFGSLAVAGVLIFAFAVGGNGSSAVGSVTIWGTLDQNAFSTVIRTVAEDDPTLSQVSYVEKEEATFEEELTSALARGEGPDLYLLRQDYAEQHSGRVFVIPFESLSAAQFQDTFVDAALPFIARDGITAIPLVVDPLVLYWNRDMLQTAGYARPPVYWDELHNMVLDLTVKNDAGRITKSTIPFGEYRNVNNAKEIMSMLIMQAGGSIVVRDNTGQLVPALSPRTGETAQATASALRFYTEFADPSKDWYTWNRALPEAQTAFAAGDLALYLGLASEEPLIRRKNPNLNFAVAPVPQIRNGDRAVNAGHAYGFAIPRTSANRNGAITVAYLLASSELSKTLSIALGIPSARRDVLSAAAPTEGSDGLFNKQAIIVRAWIDPNPLKTAKVFQDMIENTTSGATLLSEAISRADQEISEMLGL